MTAISECLDKASTVLWTNFFLICLLIAQDLVLIYLHLIDCIQV